MTDNISWGFGLEKETVLIGYNHPLKDFSYETKRSTVLNYGPESSGIRMGEYGYMGGDSTVINSGNVHDYGYEFATRGVRVKKDPKETIKGFSKEVEAASQREVKGRYDKKQSIPFGSVPNIQRYSDKVPGSYHIHLTMPFDRNKISARDSDYIAKYRIKFLKGLQCVRIIQPLIFAVTGGTGTLSIGNPPHLEGSERQLYATRTSGIGHTSIKPTSSVWNAVNSTAASGHHSRHSGRKWRNELKREFSSIGSSSFDDVSIKRYIPDVPSVEFRFLDTFDTRGVYDVFVTLSLCMANGNNIEILDSDPQKSDAWTEAMKSVAKEGWNAYVPRNYALYVKRKLKVNLNIPNEIQYIRADILLRKITKALWEKNKTDAWVKPWIHQRNPPHVHNFNKDSWEFYFIKKLKTSEVLRQKFFKFLLTIDKLDSRSSTGKINVKWKNDNTYGLRDIILDDEVLGIDYGAEDTEDILHLMHRYKFIDIKVDSSGKITYIKKKFNTKQDAIRLMKIMLNEKTMLNENSKGLLESPTIEESEETEEEVESEIEEEVQTRTEPAEDRTQVSEGFMRYDIAAISPSEDDTYMAEDMTQVFNIAGFRNNGVIQSVRSVLFSETRDSNNNEYKCFWNRINASSVDVYLDSSFLGESSLLNWVSTMRNEMRSRNDLLRVNTFQDELTNAQFFGRLNTIIRQNYTIFKVNRKPTKNRRTIELSRAGVKRLNEMGISILSLKRGHKYFITNKNKLKLLKSRYKKDINEIKYIPYRKGYYVEYSDNTLSLKNKNNNKVYDKVMRR